MDTIVMIISLRMLKKSHMTFPRSPIRPMQIPKVMKKPIKPWRKHKASAWVETRKGVKLLWMQKWGQINKKRPGKRKRLAIRTLLSTHRGRSCPICIPVFFCWLIWAQFGLVLRPAPFSAPSEPEGNTGRHSDYSVVCAGVLRFCNSHCVWTNKVLAAARRALISV